MKYFLTPKLYILCFLLFTICVSTIQAQNQKIDSLSTILKKNKDRVSSEQVDLLCNLARLLPEINAKKSRTYALQAINMAQKIDYPLGLGKGNLMMGYSYYVNGDYAKAIKYYLEAIKIQEKYDYKEELIPSLRNLGACFYRRNNDKKALEYFKKALHISIEINKKEYIYDLYNNVAVILLAQEKYDESRKNFLKALEGYRKLNHKRGEATTLNNIASTYKSQKSYNKALEYYQKSLEIDRKSNKNYSYGMIITLRSIAELHIETDNYEEAKKNLDEALKISKAIKSKDNERKVYHRYSELYKKQGNYKESLKFYKKQIALENTIFNQKKSKQIAEMRTKYETEKKEQKIKDLEQESKINTLKIEKKDLELKTSAYEAEKKEEKIKDLEQEAKINALEIEKKDLKLKASVYKAEKKEQKIKDLEQKAKIKDLNIQSKNLQLSQTRLYFVIVSITLLLTGIILYLFSRQKRLRLEQKSQHIEQKLLRVQMNPHFIFNAIIAIQEYMFDTDKQKTSIYLTKFSKLIRQILENSRNEYVALEEEVNMLENYLSLQKLRQKINFEYEIIVDEDLDIEEVAIPPMFAQPFVENAIEHGIADVPEEGKIQIHFTQENNQIILKIEDNGIGIQKSTEIKQNTEGKHKSLATQITKERIEIFKRSLKKDIGFKIQELKQGTAIIFRLPYQYV